MTRDEAFQIFLEESKKKLKDPRMNWEVLIVSAFNTAWEVAREDTACKAYEWIKKNLPITQKVDAEKNRECKIILPENLVEILKDFRKVMEE